MSHRPRRSYGSKYRGRRLLRLQPLEPRRVLSVNPISLDVSNRVRVTGSDGVDEVTVHAVSAESLQVTASIDGERWQQTFATSEVRGLSFEAFAGDDYFLNTTSIPATVDAGAGDDSVWSGLGDDTLWGGAGDDRLDGGTGNDVLRGGAGADRLFGRAGADLLLGDGGDDRIEGGVGNDVAYGGAGADSVFGDEGDDVLRGDDGRDQLYGGVGDDKLSGDAGDDYATGGEGADRISGGEGDDLLLGQAGRDLLLGEGGADRLQGGDDNDLVYGGDGADTLFGDDGQDVLRGQGDDDQVYGGAGDDTLSGDGGVDRLEGGDGKDRINGGEGDDLLLGQLGRDLLFGDGGADRLEGGAGNDLAYGGDGDDTLFGDDGQDLLRGQGGADQVYGGADDDTLSGDGGVDRLEGGDGDDDLRGGAEADRLFGQGGADRLSGDGGDDRLEGGAGNDYASGDAGDDLVLGEDGDDTLLGHSGNDNLYGGAGDDELTGGLGEDRLEGGAGEDVLSGGDQDDFLLGESGADELHGGHGADRLAGGDANDLLFGGFGDDLLFGDLGSDTLFGQQGADYLSGGEGDDTLHGGESDDRLVGDDGVDLLLGGEGDDFLSGGADADVVVGGVGVDDLQGNDGNDILIGGTGADALSGDAGEDVLIAGMMSHDNDEPALRSLVDRWNSPGDYAGRVADLSDRAAAVNLVVAATVHDDGVSNYVGGGAGQDWFLDAAVNAYYDPNAGGHQHNAGHQHDEGHGHAGMSGHGSGHHAHHTIVLASPPVVEGFALIDSFDRRYDRASDETVTTMLPHADNRSRAGEHLRLFQLVRYADVTHFAVQSGDWSDPATWSHGQVPTADARVLVPVDVTVTVDRVLPTEVFSVRVDGVLSYATDRDTELRADTVVVTPPGRYEMGTAAQPIQRAATARLVITDNGEIDRAWDPFGLSRGLIIHGAAEVHGAAKTGYAVAAGPALAGDRFVTLDAVPADWEVGDKIVIAGTAGAGEQSEERTLLGVSGNRIEVAPLDYRHESPLAGAPYHVANLTRNAVIESEGEAVSRRGHTMFMHNPDITVSYAAFNKLGRTDKSTPINDSDVSSTWDLVDGTGENGRGRYAVHFHRTGVSKEQPPAIIHGSVVDDAAGWGFVNHSGHVAVTASVVHDAFGAAFVAEAGNEIGVFDGNLAIGMQGSGEEVEGRSYAQDFGHTGEGFWLQSPGVAVTNNIVAGAGGSAYAYYMRGLIEFNGQPTRFAAANLDDPTIAGDQPTLDLTEVPISNFQGNLAYASAEGLRTHYVNRFSTHGTESVFADSVFWNTTDGIVAPYAADIVFDGFTIVYADQSSEGDLGFTHNRLTRDVTFSDVTVTGYRYGIWATRSGHTEIQSGRLANEVNVFITGAVTADREVIVSPDVVLG